MSAVRNRPRPPASMMAAVNGLWRRTMCVAGVLVGLLGMHGLAPGRAPGQDPGTDHARPAHTAAAEVQDACSDCGGHGHVQHADTVCSAAAVTGAPVLPGLVADPVPAAVADASVCSLVPGAPDGARAPPSLAE